MVTGLHRIAPGVQAPAQGQGQQRSSPAMTAGSGVIQMDAAMLREILCTVLPAGAQAAVTTEKDGSQFKVSERGKARMRRMW